MGVGSWQGQETAPVNCPGQRGSCFAWPNQEAPKSWEDFTFLGILYVCIYIKNVYDALLGFKGNLWAACIEQL